MVARAAAPTTAARKRTTKAAPEPQDAKPTAPVGVLLFEKNGRTWQSTADRNFGSALLYLRSIKRKTGIVEAEMGLVEHLLGEKDTDSLLDAVSSRAEWTQILGRAVQYHLGTPEEEPEGN